MCQQRLQELKERLLGRGYRSRVIDNAIEKVHVVDREQMLRKVVRDNKSDLLYPWKEPERRTLLSTASTSQG